MITAVTHSKVLLGLLVVIIAIQSNAAGQSSSSFEAPDYTGDNRWEYGISGQISAPIGLNNTTGSVQVHGTTLAETASREEDVDLLSWRSELSLAGAINIRIEEIELLVELVGGVEVSRMDSYEEDLFLPTRVESLSEFQLEVTGLFLPVTYVAVSAFTANITPRSPFPTYPLQEGEIVANFRTHLESNLTFSFGQTGVTNSSIENFDTSLLLDVTEGRQLDTPAGNFTTVRVATDVLEGAALGPFQELFPGTRQVAYYSNEVGNAVLFQFFLEDVEVGNATLRSFSYSPSGGTPLWQHPAFIGGLLLIPAAVLIYFYRRERKKGL